LSVGLFFRPHGTARLSTELIFTECDQSLYYRTNEHNVKNVELLKLIKIMEAAPTCFGEGFSKIYPEIQVPLKSYKSNGYFTSWTVYIYDIIWL